MPEFPITPKVWGKEVLLVNEPEYCSKKLIIKKRASGSLHYHPVKKETFILVSGKVHLEYGDKDVILKVGSMPVTILPRTPHRFKGLQRSVILEVSTHHEDNDIIRLEMSKKA